MNIQTMLLQVVCRGQLCGWALHNPHRHRHSAPGSRLLTLVELVILVTMVVMVTGNNGSDGNW